MLFQTVLNFKLEGYRLPSLTSRTDASRACQQFLVFAVVVFLLVLFLFGFFFLYTALRLHKLWGDNRCQCVQQV